MATTWPDWAAVVGRRVAALRGYEPDLAAGHTRVRLEFVLFDDGATFLELDRQDRYSYHDYDPRARVVGLVSDPARWQAMMGCTGEYRATTADTNDPFC